MSSTTTSEVELARIRCPIGECKTFELPAAHGSDITIGDLVVSVDTLAMAISSGVSEIVVCAYEIPMVVVDCRASAAINPGAALGYIAASDVFVENSSDLSVVAHALEYKAANVSEILVHFDGRVKYQLMGAGSDVAPDFAI